MKIGQILSESVRHATSRSQFPLSLSWLSFLGVLFFISLRVHTYASGQDPFVYMLIVQELIYRPNGWSAAIKACLQYGPGWSVFLACVRVIFGSLAMYAVTPLAFMALMILLYRFFKRIFPVPEQAFLGAVATGSVMLTGLVVSSHFLLYPFRGTFCYFLVFLAYACCGSMTGQAPRRACILFAAVFVAYAILVREPMVFVAAAIFLFILTDRVPWRWKTLFLFCLPYLIPLVAFAGSALVTGSFGTEQLELWWNILKRRYAAGMGDTVLQVSAGQLNFLHASLGWVGWTCLLVALVRYGRNRTFLCLLVFPALALFSFYALYDVAHPRYVLSVLMFVAPAASCGLIFLVDQLLRRGSLARINSRWVYLALSLTFLVQLGVAGKGMVPLWHAKVDAHDVRDLKQQIKSFARAEDVLCTEWYFNILGETVTAHTSHPLVAYPDDVLAFLDTGRRCFFLKPLDPKAAIYKSRPVYFLPIENMLRYRAELVPVKDVDQRARKITFLDFPYQVFEVKVRTQTEVSQICRPQSGDAPFLWLNLQSGATGVTVIDLMRDGNVLTHWEREVLTPYVVIALEAHVAAEPFTVRVRRSEPLPARPVMGFQREDKFVFHALGPGREQAVEKMFTSPLNLGPSEVREHAFFHYDFGAQKPPGTMGPRKEPGVIIPTIIGDASQIDVSLFFNVYPREPGTLNMAYRAGGQSVGEFPFDLNSQENRHYLSLTGEPLPKALTFKVQSPQPLQKHIRFTRLGIRLKK